MPTVTLLRAGSGLPATTAARGPVSVLSDDLGNRVVLPFAPLPVEIGGVAPEWQAVDRGASRLPLLLRGASSLRTERFQLTLARADFTESIDDVLAALERIAGFGGRVAFAYGRPERGLWRITDFTSTVTDRAPGTQAPSRANVSLTLTAVSDLPASVGAPPAAVPRPSTSTSSGRGGASRVHVVVAGDTLWALAVRFLGTGTRWRELADANKVRDPRKLRIGTRLVIPAR